MRLSEPLADIFHITFEKNRDMAETFMRFQEHYESPEFRGKIFTREEFERWYTAHSEGGKETRGFTYCEDWGGFNIPSYVLEPFHDGKFDPLSEGETALLRLFEGRRQRLFYIFATREKKKASTFDHELAHGLFYTNESYRDAVLSVLSRIHDGTRREMHGFLLGLAGYHPSVIDDESHAYLISDPDFFEKEADIRDPSLAGVSTDLRALFRDASGSVRKGEG